MRSTDKEKKFLRKKKLTFLVHALLIDFNENFKIVEREYPSLKWAEWETWSSCSKSCGDGIQTRKRTIENPELIYEHQETSYVPFGLECDAEEDKKCNLEPCPGKIFFSTKLSLCYLEKPP